MNAADPAKQEPDVVLYEGLRLPPPQLRWGGPRYREDARYVRSARKNVETLAGVCGLGPESRVLDIGCGPARLLTGMTAVFGRVSQYVGLDVHAGTITWAQRHLATDDETVVFRHLDIFNARYNRRGRPLTGREFLPVSSASFDVVVLISVFSHMRLDDIKRYCREIERVLVSGGKVYLTLFVEHGVSDETENPADYHREWSGPLHCVRVNRHTFEDVVYDSGLAVEYFHYRQTNDGQSTYVLMRGDEPAFRANVHR